MFSDTKGIKRVISISAAALCMLTAARFPAAVPGADAADNVLTAFEITEDMKIGWNLGNTLDATSNSANPGVSSETAWGQPVTTQALVDAVKAKGFNTMRVPITWYQHLDSDNNIDPAWLARVHEVVDYAYKSGMYVIINVHHENWINRADIGDAYDEIKPRLMKIWTQLANEFKDYDQHLIFECMNEPRAYGTTHEWWGPQQNEVDCINQLNADFVELIRSIDSPYKDTRLLMIPDYCASSDISIMSKLVVPDDDYVAASIHAYSPYGFTMDKSVADHSTFNESYQTELANILEGIRTTFIAKDIPVVIGEFSASNFGNTEARVQWAEQYISTTKAMGIPCVLWDNDARDNKDVSERHDYIDRHNLVWYEDSVQVVDKMMSVLADDTIVWGGKKEGTKYDHEDISTGNILFTGSAELDANHKGADGKADQNCMNTEAVWTQLDGGDIAVEFTGDTPAAIALTDGSWLGWTEVKPYDVDTKKGIAYFSADSVKNAWGADKVDSIAHLFVRTDGVTTVKTISVIGATSGEIIEPEDKTKKYQIDLSNVSRNGKMVINFNGEAGTYINGAVGFMGAEDWTSIEWEGTIDEGGKLQVIINTSDIYAGATSGEIQIWYNADKADLLDWNVFGMGDEPAPLYGDANCDDQVNMADAVYVMQCVTNPDKYQFEGNGERNADVDGTPGITNKDALCIQQLKLSIISQFPVEVTLDPTYA